jgi:hypothetical protein
MFVRMASSTRNSCQVQHKYDADNEMRQARRMAEIVNKQRIHVLVDMSG